MPLPTRAWLFDEWTAPYPEPLNYALVDTRLNETPHGGGGTAPPAVNAVGSMTPESAAAPIGPPDIASGSRPDALREAHRGRGCSGRGM